MRPNHSLYGDIRDGFTQTIRVVGSNGIADTSWEGDAKMMRVKFAVGARFVGTSRNCGKIAFEATWHVGANNAKLCCIGLMTHARFESSERTSCAA